MLGGAVELLAVHQRAAVVDLDGIGGNRLGAGALGDDLVLEAIVEGGDAGLGLVFLQEVLTLHLVELGLRFFPGFGVGLGILGELADGSLPLFFSHLELGFVQCVAEAALQGSLVNRDVVVLQVLRKVGDHVCANGVAGLLFIGCKRSRRLGGRRRLCGGLCGCGFGGGGLGRGAVLRQQAGGQQKGAGHKRESNSS